jgi:hypothetical protein
MSYKGKFVPKNFDKYNGDPTNIIYRSSWELKLMIYLDEHSDIVKWSSEEFCIPYISPIDRKVHRYFPDFWVKKKTGRCMLIEVKPAAQTKPPDPIKKNKTKTGRPSRRYLNEVKTYGINEAKWKAAYAYCRDRKWEFKIMTEKELGV